MTDPTLTTAAAAAMLAVLGFAVLAPRWGRRLAPALATRLLVPASLAVAACSVFVLGVVAFTWLGQVPEIAALGSWSPSRLDSADPLPDPVSAASLLLLAAAIGWTIVVIARRVRALISIYRTASGFPAAGPVVLIDSARPDAFTTPAPTGRIVVTTGLWNVLSPAERRVVLAHERSHLTHRHTWWTLAAGLAAAVNPLLRPTAAIVGQAVERWADEDATRAVGDRQLVARTIARAALLRHDTPARSAVAPAASGGDVPQRVRALLDPPPRRRPVTLLALAAVLLAGALATLAVQRTGEHLFEHAALPGVHTLHHGHHHRSA